MEHAALTMAKAGYLLREIVLPEMFSGLLQAQKEIIGEHKVSGFLGDFSALPAHGNADIGAFECRCIIDTITGHRHHFAFGL